MKFNLPAWLRLSLYGLTAVGTPVVAYLKVKGYIGDHEVNLWFGEVTVVAALAGFNVTTNTSAAAAPADAELGEGE